MRGGRKEKELNREEQGPIVNLFCLYFFLLSGQWNEKWMETKSSINTAVQKQTNIVCLLLSVFSLFFLSISLFIFSLHQPSLIF